MKSLIVSLQPSLPAVLWRLVVVLDISDSLGVQSDLAYPVLFYPDPSPSGRKSLVTDLQHLPCIHTVCVFDYPVPSPIRIFLWKTDVCGYARSDCAILCATWLSTHSMEFCFFFCFCFVFSPARVPFPENIQRET